MHCPFCGFLEDRVVDSRLCQEGRAIRRRRECLNCQHRFTTYETLERPNIQVIKKDNRREPYDKQKILNGLMKACEKRPVSLEKIENIASEIERYIENKNIREISTQEIGEQIMNHLQALDEVAFVRFASVYRQFKDVTQFMNEIVGLLSEKRSSPTPNKQD
ncbi:MAG: transcriptional regulator NrdR [Candidatus Auribacterota bacterium]|nr:transcriptional regulator NrdR [Candidatus Auribacterota bacterium]